MLKWVTVNSIRALGGWSLVRHLTRNVPRIFMLHRFSARPDGRRTHVDELVRLVGQISAQCELVTVRELVSRLARTDRIHRPLAAITVDDGYADFHSVALPVLAERRIPATLYATAGFVEGSCWLWWDALRHLLDEHPGGQVELELGGRRFLLELGGAQSRHAAWSEIADFLVTRNVERIAALEQLSASAGVALPARPPDEYAPMSWTQLREAAATGIEIGGHSMTHAFLPGLDSESLRLEITAAKQLVESRLSLKLRTFAYPNGSPADWSAAVEDVVRAAGFEAAVLAHPRAFLSADLYRLGRHSVSSSEPRLAYILSGLTSLKLAWRSR
jgi:peptidoglycan/xylan/chitin deacetylase (PgdA/CDA1 family)